jgi:phytoene dehydrogenase-like protein
LPLALPARRPKTFLLLKLEATSIAGKGPAYRRQVRAGCSPARWRKEWEEQLRDTPAQITLKSHTGWPLGTTTGMGSYAVLAATSAERQLTPRFRTESLQRLFADFNVSFFGMASGVVRERIASQGDHTRAPSGARRMRGRLAAAACRGGA